MQHPFSTSCCLWSKSWLQSPSEVQWQRRSGCQTKHRGAVSYWPDFIVVPRIDFQMPYHWPMWCLICRRLICIAQWRVGLDPTLWFSAIFFGTSFDGTIWLCWQRKRASKISAADATWKKATILRPTFALYVSLETIVLALYCNGAFAHLCFWCHLLSLSVWSLP